MNKKNTIIIFILLFFSVLNIAPYFMVRCTETNGNSHLDNVFSMCCNSSMNRMPHSLKLNNIAAFSVSYCECSVNISSGQYLMPHTDKIVAGQDIIAFRAETQGEIINERSISSYKSESPPISVNLVRSVVLLI